MNTGRTSYVAAMAASSVLLLAAASACQPSGQKSVSLEEAKQATASFGDEGLTAPPRRVDDILSLLEEAPRASANELAELQAKASEQPPADASARELARFYFDRSKVARQLGLMKQHVEDAELAYQHAETVYGDKVFWSDNRSFLSNAAYAEWGYGNHERAKELFAKYYRIARLPGERIHAVGDLAATSAWSGNATEAERYLREFESIYERLERRDVWARYKWEEVHSAYLWNIGRFEEAEKHFRRIIADLPDLPSDQDALVANWSDYALMLLQSGRLLDAEVEAREALKATIDYAANLNANVSYSIIVLSEVLAAQGRTNEAILLLRKAIDLYETSGASPQSDMIRNGQRSLAFLLAAEGDWTSSRALFETLLKTGTNTWVDESIRSSSAYPMVLIETGSLSEAITTLRASHDRMAARLGEKHATTAELDGVLAAALARSGEREEALRFFRSTIPILASRSREMQRTGGEATASERTLDYILANYLRLLGDIRGTAIEASAGLDAVDEAFQIADLARGRSVQQAINATAARSAASDPALADLARREQDAKQQISALYALLSRAKDDATSTDLRARIDTLRGARAALMEEIERRYPEYAALINPKPLSVAETRALLHPGEALVSLYVGPEESYVWAVSAENVAFQRVALSAANIDSRVAALRKALNPAASTLGEIPPFDVAAAHELYKAILEPVSAAWKSSETLVVVPHRALAQLPLALLPTKAVQVDETVEPLFAGYRVVPWIARNHAVVTMPSVSAFAALRRLPSPNPARTELAAFGDPIFTPSETASAVDQTSADASLSSRGLLAVRGLPVKLRAAPGTEASASAQLAMLPRLPETADEVRGIAVALSADPAASVFLGPDASEQRVKTMNLADRRVLVFATHGLVPGDLDGLTQPALALSNPALAEGGGDGLLTMGEILALKLDADWVVLSACNTAAGEGAGSEAISGLGRAFLYAGARALLVSNWPVETTSTRILTTGIFNGQAGDPALSRAGALQQSMLGLIDGPGHLDSTGTAVFSYAHPIFWAPFSLVGDGA